MTSSPDPSFVPLIDRCAEASLSLFEVNLTFHFMVQVSGIAIDVAESLLDGFYEHLVHRLAGSPLPSHARKARISRGQQSLVKVAVTVWPESYLISKPSDLAPGNPCPIAELMR